MIIPANEQIARKISGIPLHFKIMLEYLNYICKAHCQEDILVCEVFENQIFIDIPVKSRFNGVVKLMSVMNNAWTFDPMDLSEKTLILTDSPRGKFLCLRKCNRTTDMHHKNMRGSKYENIKMV